MKPHSREVLAPMRKEKAEKRPGTAPLTGPRAAHTTPAKMTMKTEM